MFEDRPIYPVHPGDVLAEELEVRGLTGADLARALHVPANRIYQLLAGKRSMTADTAVRLQKWLGVEAEFWLALQAQYELDVIRRDSSVKLLDEIVPIQTVAAA